MKAAFAFARPVSQEEVCLNCGAKYSEAMQVKVLCFGALRESLGNEFVLEMPAGTTVFDLLQTLARLPMPMDASTTFHTCAIAVNQEYVARDHLLCEGDEVALLPPVSGGSGPHVELCREPIVTAGLLRDFSLGEDGAIVTFEGVVRNNTRGRRTVYLDYEAYEEMALLQMQKLASAAIRDHGVRDVLLVHRLGRIEIGEPSVVIAVAGAHRAPVFTACRWLIDTLKQTVPIWKKEHFADGAVWAQGEPFPAELTR